MLTSRTQQWIISVAIASIPMIFILWPTKATEQLVAAYIFPGMIPMALIIGIASRILNLSDDTGVILFFISSGILSAIFWGAMLWGLYRVFTILKVKNPV